VYSAQVYDLEALQQRVERECLSGDSSETRNFRQSAHVCKKKLKVVLKYMEPHRASAVEITRTSPIFQQAMVSGHMMTGTALLI
jgi:hypothetical protein